MANTGTSLVALVTVFFGLGAAAAVADEGAAMAAAGMAADTNVQSGSVADYRADVAAGRADIMLAWGGADGGGSSGGGSGGGSSGGGSSGGGSSGGGSSGGGSSGGGSSGGGSSGGGSSGGAAGGAAGSAGDTGDAAGRGGGEAGVAATDSLGLANLGLDYAATQRPLNPNIVQRTGPVAYAPDQTANARLAALDPQVRDQVMARMGPEQTVAGVIDTTLLNQTSRQYAGASHFWIAPETDTILVVGKDNVRRPVEFNPRTLQTVSPPT